MPVHSINLVLRALSMCQHPWNKVTYVKAKEGRAGGSRDSQGLTKLLLFSGPALKSCLDHTTE